MSADVSLEPYDPAWLETLIPAWRASFEDGVGIRDPHPIADQRRYFVDQVLASFTVRVAVVDGAPAGFIAASAQSIAQLYVWIGLQGRGVGTRMLDWAKAQSSGRLWLYTFAQNKRACAFYERHGFVAVARGFEPTWKLADVRYEWTSAGDAAGEIGRETGEAQ